MKRREFIALIAGAAVAWPLTARPQHPAKIHRIGLLGDTSWEPLRQSLRDLGYVEGQTIGLESRSSEGQSERWSDLATELVRLNVDIIVTLGTPATLAARTATTTIPIVMVGVGAPIKTGLILSLARPGGNITGLGQLGAELASKRLELLKETLPNISRVAFLWNSANPDQKFHLDEVQAAARALGMTLQSVEVRSREELERAFATMTRERPSAMLLTADSLLQHYIERIVAFASTNRLPAMYQLKEYVDRGGLMSYGASSLALERRAAAYVDRILKGTRPADLPVEEPTKFELIINLKTAKAIGLTVPLSLLSRADEVIE